MEHQPSKYRNSRMEFDNVYFWTNTVKDWKKLLKLDKYKEIIMASWQELTDRKLIAICGFVIMPNHLHVVWEMLEPNGKEAPHASFNKYTSHMILKDLRTSHPDVLPFFKVDDPERKHRIWQRDPLAVGMDSKQKVEQKIGRGGVPLHAQQPTTRTLESGRPARKLPLVIGCLLWNRCWRVRLFDPLSGSVLNGV